MHENKNKNQKNVERCNKNNLLYKPGSPKEGKRRYKIITVNDTNFNEVTTKLTPFNVLLC